MAKFTPILGQLSGKLEGMVFSRNKSGFYIRGNSKPIDPKTAAQLNVRANFASVATAWHNLTDSNKQAWNTFSEFFFKPKFLKAGVVYSGINAFQSLRTASKQGNSRARAVTATDTSLASVTLTQGDFLDVATPSNGIFSASISTLAGGALPISAQNMEMSADGTGSFEIAFVPQASAPDFTEPNTNTPVGYTMMFSNPNSQAEQYFVKSFMSTLGAVKPITAVSGFTASDTSIKMEFAGADINKSDFKWFPQTGDTVRLSVFQISQSGAQIIVGVETFKIV